MPSSHSHPLKAMLSAILSQAWPPLTPMASRPPLPRRLSPTLSPARSHPGSHRHALRAILPQSCPHGHALNHALIAMLSGPCSHSHALTAMLSTMLLQPCSPGGCSQPCSHGHALHALGAMLSLPCSPFSLVTVLTFILFNFSMPYYVITHCNTRPSPSIYLNSSNP